MVGLEVGEQPEKQLCANRIEKDSRHRDVLIEAITESCDPFSSPATESPHLLNIASGKAASQTTEQYLNGALTTGRELRLGFQDECASDNARFSKPITRRKVANFAQENLAKKQHVTKGHTAAESLQDVFLSYTHLFFIVSENTDFNLRHLMTFPVTDYPLAIAHSDGSGFKTDKSNLLRKLEQLQDGFATTPLPPIDVTLIDGGLLIHSFLSSSSSITSYGHLARNLLSCVCASPGSQIHVLLDTYRTTSLKAS